MLIQNKMFSIKIIKFKFHHRSLLLWFFMMPLTGCSNIPWFPSAGISRSDVVNVRSEPVVESSIKVISPTRDVTKKIVENQRKELFSTAFKRADTSGLVVGPGDIIQISIWESPPTILFSNAVTASQTATSAAVRVDLPQAMIEKNGTVSIPFVGQINVIGKSLTQIQADITDTLRYKANHPQVIASLIKNNSSVATIMGEVQQTGIIPLTPKGERLMDALAISGGLKQPVNKTTIQLTRNNQARSLPLETIIKNPEQNIILQPGDVVTAFYQPFSFTVLGATGQNNEINFEAQGISLVQAIARSGGLLDNQSDARGVFLFRFEDPANLDQTTQANVRYVTAEGKVPVVYQFNLKDPHTFFVAQDFPMLNKDIIFVSVASSSELQKFLNVLTSSIYSVSNLNALSK
jgi:polysaccharide biosynthesis/export protein